MPISKNPLAVKPRPDAALDDNPWAEEVDVQKEADMFKMVLGTRRQLGTTKKLKFIIDPRSSKMINLWDAIQVFCLIFTAFVTPLQVAFTEAADTAWDPLFLIDRCIDCIFIVDMILQFFLMYPAEKISKAEAEQMQEELANINLHGTQWVMDPAKIAAHYLSTWFTVDILSIAASATDIVAVAQASGADCDEETRGVGPASKLRALRVLRVLRLMKLVRLLKASRVLKRWMSRIPINYGTLILVKCMMYVLVCSHWIACVWKLQVWFAPTRMQTWEATFGWCVYGSDPTAFLKDEQCGPSAVETCPAPYHLTGDAGICCVDIGSLYVAAISWSLMIITGVGGTDLVALGPANNGISTTENLVFCVLVIIGNAILWTQVIAAFVDVASNANPLNIKFRQTMDDLNHYMKAQMMPPEMRRRLREYFQEVHGVHIAEAQEKVVLQMSPMLQREVVLRANRHWLQKIWFIRGAESSVFVQIVINLQPHVFAPGEIAPDEILYIITKGVVVLGRDILVSGQYFGHESILITKKSLRSKFVGRMMSYVQCNCLTKGTFLEIISRFPEAKRVVRRASVVLALRAAIIQAARVQKKKSAGFLDVMLDAAQNSDEAQRAKGMPTLNMASGGGSSFAMWRDMVRNEIAFAINPIQEAIDQMMVLHGLRSPLADADADATPNQSSPRQPAYRPAYQLPNQPPHQPPYQPALNGRPPAVSVANPLAYRAPLSAPAVSRSSSMALPSKPSMGETPRGDPRRSSRGASFAAAVPGNPDRRVRRVKRNSTDTKPDTQL